MSNSPFSAGATVPDTGASMKAADFFSISWEILIVVLGLIVLISINNRPLTSLLNNPFSDR